MGEFFNAFRHQLLSVVDGMHVLALLLKLAIYLHHLVIDAFDLRKFLLLLVGVRLKLAEQLSQLVPDGVLPELACLHKGTDLVLLSHQFFELFLELLDLLIDASHFQVVFGVVRLLKQLLGHIWHDCIDRDEQVVVTTTPFAGLVFTEARTIVLFGRESFVLILHFLALLLEGLSHLFLLAQLFLRLLVAICCCSAASLRFARSLSLLTFFCFADLFAIDDSRERLVTASPRAPRSSRLLGLLGAIIEICICGSGPSVASRLRSPRLAILTRGLIRSSSRFFCFNAINFLLL